MSSYRLQCCLVIVLVSLSIFEIASTSPVLWAPTSVGYSTKTQVLSRPFPRSASAYRWCSIRIPLCCVETNDMTWCGMTALLLPDLKIYHHASDTEEQVAGSCGYCRSLLIETSNRASTNDRKKTQHKVREGKKKKAKAAKKNPQWKSSWSQKVACLQV